MGKDTYYKPETEDVGSLQELTQQQFNKIGPAPDALTSVNPNVIGSFTPVP